MLVVSDFDSCHFKEEIGEMALQQTNKEYQESQNRKRETHKRQVEQKKGMKRINEKKKQDEDRNEKKGKELKGYLTSKESKRSMCS